MRAYAIGDIHGQFELLKQAHDLIARDAARFGPAPVIHLGDLVDRGPNSKGVITFLRRGIAGGEDWVVLQGNHERMMAGFIDNPHAIAPRQSVNWLHPRIGGGASLASYGIKNPSDRPIAPVHAEALLAIPPEDISFIKSLPLVHQIGGLFFVHAGIRPNIALSDQSPDDLLWIREPFLSDPSDHDVLVIHGHTALPEPCHYGNRVNLDSSAGYGGALSVVIFECQEVFRLTQLGRQRLPITPQAKRR